MILWRTCKAKSQGALTGVIPSMTSCDSERSKHTVGTGASPRRRSPDSKKPQLAEPPTAHTAPLCCNGPPNRRPEFRWPPAFARFLHAYEETCRYTQHRIVPGLVSALPSWPAQARTAHTVHSHPSPTPSRDKGKAILVFFTPRRETIKKAYFWALVEAWLSSKTVATSDI